MMASARALPILIYPCPSFRFGQLEMLRFAGAASRASNAPAAALLRLQRLAKRVQVSITESGFSDIDSMPSSASQSAKSG